MRIKLKAVLPWVLKIPFFAYLFFLTLIHLLLFFGVVFYSIAEEGFINSFFMNLFCFFMMSIVYFLLVGTGLLGYYFQRKKNMGSAWYVIWFVVQLFFLFVVPHLLDFDQVGDCYNDGGVWDHHEERCRYDCQKWDKELGCIPLNIEPITAEISSSQ